MFRLIQSEYKKLWKKKVPAILLLLLLGWTFYSTMRDYHKEMPSMALPVVFESEDHQKIRDGLEYYQYADTYLHQYAGELSEDLVEQMESDYHRLMKKYERKTLDHKRMSEAYGEDWENFIKTAAQGGYDQEQLDVLLADMTYSGYSSDGEHYYFEIYYEEDPMLMLYERIYTGTTQYLTSDSLYSVGGEDEEKEIELKSYPFTKQKPYLKDQITMYKGIQSAQEQELFDNLLDKRIDTTASFDSVVGNQLFLNSLGNIDMLTLVFIILLLSDIFSQEVSYKSDQIIVPTKEGAKRLVVAKLLCGISAALGIILLQFLIILGCAMVFVPLHSLALPMMAQANGGYFGMIPYVFTYREGLIGTLLLIILASLATAVLTMALSLFTKNRFATVSVMMIILFGGFMLSLYVEGGLAYVSSLLPPVMMKTTAFFSWKSNGFLPVIPVGGSMITWRYAVSVIWILFMLLLCGFIVRYDHRHIVKNT